MKKTIISLAIAFTLFALPAFATPTYSKHVDRKGKQYLKVKSTKTSAYTEKHSLKKLKADRDRLIFLIDKAEEKGVEEEE